MTSEEFRNNPMLLRNQFAGDGVFEMPKLRKDEINLEKIDLIGYDKLSENETDKIVHFFLDYQAMQSTYNAPQNRNFFPISSLMFIEIRAYSCFHRLEIEKIFTVCGRRFLSQGGRMQARKMSAALLAYSKGI